MAIKFSQFNLRTDHTSGMYLVGYDGNQNIHITVDNLFDDFINGTENTIAMFGTGGTVLADSILSQDAGATLLTVAGQLNVDAAATFDTSVTVTGDSTLNGNVILGDASTDLITQTGTLYLNGPVKDTTDTLGAVDQVLLSDATGELTFTDLANLHVGGAEVVEVPVKNVQGSALVKGDPVYISGSVGASGRLEVQLADASNTLKMPAVGLLKQDLADNAEGFAVVTGKLRNLITDPIDGVTPTENDVIYVKPSGTSGAALTTTKPVYGNFIQNIGKVGRVSTSNDGNFVVSSILRTNDIPNLTPGRLWIGSTGNTIESQTLFVDEANGRLGINEANPGYSLDVDGTLQTSGWAYFATTGPTSVAQLGGGSTTTSQFNIISTATGGSFIAATNTLTLKANNLNAIEIDNTGELQFNQYGTGAFTGTPTKNLSVDGFGNVIETNPAVDGSGTLNYVSKWTPDGNTLGDSIIFDNGTQVGIGTESVSTFKLTVAGGVKIDGSNLNITNIIPAIYLNSSNSNPDWSLNNQGGEFSIRNNTLSQRRLTISSTGQVGFTLYGQNTFTGTAAKNLSVTSSGAIIETDAVPANIVETITTTDGTYINLTPNAATDGNVTVTADLSAVDGTAVTNERYLTKNNTWAEVAAIPGTYDWDISDGVNLPDTIASGETVTFAGGTDLTTAYAASTNTLTIDHDAISRANSNATRNPGYGGTFTVVDNIVTSATGHVTGVNLLTVTMPSAENYTWTLDGDGGTPQAISSGDVVTFVGGTNITTEVNTPAGDNLTIDLDDSITLAGELTVNGTGQSSFAGQVTIPQTPSAGTDAASKHYVDQAVTGALSYQGGYNAATNTPDLDSSPSSSIKKGWTYTVTADGLFFTEQVRVGDVIIAEVDAPTTLANWTTVQNNIDLADASTVGIGNVAGGTDISVSYSSGTATVSQDAVTLNQNTSSATPGSGGTFTAIDSVTTNSTGHLTDYNLKTVTLPAAGVSGSGTANYISKWNTTSALTDSLIYDTGTELGVATTSPDSGVILQVGDGTVSEKVRIYDSSNSYIDLMGSGVYFTRNNSYLRPAGTASAQTLYIGDNLGGSNPNRSWGAIRSNFNDFWFTDNGVKVMRIHNENVGIGAGAVYPNSASEKLHIDGNFRLTGSFKDGSNGAGTSGQVLSSTGTSTSWITAYGNSDVDAHLNTGTATSNQVLSWTGTDYDWVTSSASNDYVNAASFNTGDGILTLTRTDTGTVTVDLDGRFLTGNQTITLSGDVTGSGTTSISTSISSNVVGANELNVSGNGTSGQVLISDGDGTFSWSTLGSNAYTSTTIPTNNNQLTNGAGYITSASLPTVNNATLTVQGTGALGGSGTFTANQSTNATISISHDDTSSQGSVNNSGNTVIQDITLDTYGHVTGIGSTTLSIPTNNNQLTNGAGYITSFTNYYLDGISKSGNTLTFSVNGTTNQSYTFGSNAFNSTTIPTNNNQLTNGAGYITSSGTAAKIFAGGTGPSTENLNTVANNVSVGQLEYRGFNGSSSNAPPTSDNANGVITVGQHSGNYNAQLAFSSDGNMYWRDNPSTSFGAWRKMWDSGNDGSGSTLDADLLDGQHGSYYLNYNNFTNTPTIPTNNNQLTNGAGYITGYTETDTLSTVLGRGNTTSTGASFYSNGIIAKLSSSTSQGSHSDAFIVGHANYQNKGAMYLHGDGFIGTATIEYGYANTGLTMRATSNGTFTAVSFRDGIYSQRGSIQVSTSSTTYNTTSDYRLKENVIEITDGIERVKQLQPKRFNFISEPDVVVDGFLAHEAQEVVPESVTGEKDAMQEVVVTPAEYDDEGNLITEAVMGTEEDYQGIDQSKLVPLLTAALKEAIAKIEDLEARVIALEP